MIRMFTVPPGDEKILYMKGYVLVPFVLIKIITFLIT